MALCVRYKLKKALNKIIFWILGSISKYDKFSWKFRGIPSKLVCKVAETGNEDFSGIDPSKFFKFLRITIFFIY